MSSSVFSESIAIPNLAASFAAAAGGNLTENGFYVLLHSFRLVFCGTGAEEDGSCADSKENGAFSYAKVGDDNFARDLVDIGASDKWTIKREALSAFRAAFSSLPVIIHSPALKPIPMLKGSNNPPPEHDIHVCFNWRGTNPELYSFFPDAPPVGQTFSKNYSCVYYLSLLGEIQVLLGPAGSYLSPSSPNDSKFGDFAAELGKGVGNVAVHEATWQLSYIKPLPGLECGRDTMTGECPPNESYLFEPYLTPGTYFQTTAPTLHWMPTNTCTIEQILMPQYNLNHAQNLIRRRGIKGKNLLGTSEILL